MSAPELTIRNATLADYAATCTLFDQLDELHRERLPWLFRAPDGPTRSLEYFERMRGGSDSAMLVAELAQQPAQGSATIVGAALVLLRTSPDFPILVPLTWVVVDGIVVAKEQRRRGLGTQLLQGAERWGAERGATSVHLDVHSFNEEAEAFYAARGYIPFTRRLRKSLAT